MEGFVGRATIFPATTSHPMTKLLSTIFSADISADLFDSYETDFLGIR